MRLLLSLVLCIPATLCAWTENVDGYLQLAVERPLEAKRVVTFLPRNERTQILESYLKSPDPALRKMGAELCKNTLEEGLIGALQKAIEGEKDRAASGAMEQAIEYLGVYKNIALPEEETARFFPAESGKAGLDKSVGAVDLSLRVLDRSGKPVPRATVFAYSSEYANGRKILTALPSPCIWAIYTPTGPISRPNDSSRDIILTRLHGRMTLSFRTKNSIRRCANFSF